MKHAAAKKKKRRPRAAASSGDRKVEEEGEGEGRRKMVEDFGGLGVSVEEANKMVMSEIRDDPSTSSSVLSGGSSSLEVGSSSSSGGSSTEWWRLMEREGKKGGNKQKRTVAVTGTVANVLGKEYARASTKSAAKVRVWDDEKGFDKEEVEQFLYSMLGDECELSIAVVRDVLGQCGYNVEKALEVLLDLSSSSNEQSGNCSEDWNSKDETRLERCNNWTDRASDCTSQSSESDLLDGFWSTGYSRNYSKVLTSSEDPSPAGQSVDSDLSQKVLDSLFNISKSPEHAPSTMNWRNVVKKLQSLGPQFDVSSNITAQQEPCAKGDEYQVLRKDAKQHWDSMKSCYQKATEAHSKGNREYAAYLSDQGRIQTRLAQVADKKASHDIFKARNKGIENVITIDLHGQHVKPAMKLFKLHLVLGSYVPSVQTLRVITGCGTQGLGKSKVKQSVIKLLENEGMQWREENRGTVLIKLDGYREYNFLETGSDSE